MTLTVLLLLAAVALAPPPRRPRRPARRTVGGRAALGPPRGGVLGGGVLGGGGLGGGRGGRVRPGGPRSARASGRRSARQVDAGLLVSEVAMRLRAGADPARAWGAALGRSRLGPAEDRAELDGTGVPVVLTTLSARLGGRGPWSRRPARGEADRAAAGVTDRATVGVTDRATAGETAGSAPGARTGPERLLRRASRAERAALRGAVAGVVAACRVTHSTGAPLAEILDRSAEGIAESARAAGARTVALAGPRATGRLLGWLPLLGLALGSLVGADPIGTLLDGGIGTAALAAGSVLLIAGWAWVLRAERAAERIGP